MTIKDEENKSTWIEVKDIIHQCYPQKTKTKEGKDHDHPFFTITVEDYDGYEYCLNFLPYQFLRWVDKETLKGIADYIKKDLDQRV